MSYTVQDYKKDFVREHLNLLSADEVLKRYSPDEVLKRYSVNDRIKDLSSDDIIENLSPEYLKALVEKLKIKGD